MSQSLLPYPLTRKKTNTVHIKCKSLFPLCTPTRLLFNGLQCQNSFHTKKIRWYIVRLLHTQATTSTIGDYCTIMENAAVYLLGGMVCYYYIILGLNFFHPFSQSFQNFSSSFQDCWSLLWVKGYYWSQHHSWLYQDSSQSPAQGV